MQWYQYNKGIDTTFQGVRGTAWSSMIIEDGVSYKTVQGTIYGTAIAAGGLLIVDGSNNAIIGFTSFQSNDGTLSYPPQTYSMTLTGAASGSHYTVIKNSDNSILYSGTSTGANIPLSYVWLSDVAVTIRVRKSTVAPKYLPYETTATLGQGNFSVAINQITDPNA